MTAVKKQRVALDVNGVLANVLGVMLEIRKKAGFIYTRDNPGEYTGHGGVFLGLDNDSFEAMYNDMWQNMWRQIRCTVSEDELLQFCKDYDVALVTSRYDNALQPLKDWLALDYPSTKLEILAVPKGVDKATLPFDIYIDDAPSLAGKMSVIAGKRLFLVRTGYNKTVHRDDARGITIVKDLSEAIHLPNNEINSRKARVA